MANSRKKGKKRVNFWLTEEEIELLEDFAEFKGVNKTDAFRILLIKSANAADRKIKKGDIK